MITTFLWMLYLAFTLLTTRATIVQFIYDLIQKRKQDIYDFIIAILTCLLWSIWYFYYLN